MTLLPKVTKNEAEKAEIPKFNCLHACQLKHVDVVQ